MKVRLNDRIWARRLRTEGKSFSEIIGKIPNLTKGTLNGWLKDIELTRVQKEKILNKIKTGAEKGRIKGAFTNHQKRVKDTENAFSEAKRELKSYQNDPFFVAGLMLYWAEGYKSAERIEFTNSDPSMIKFMMIWFRKICRVNESRFRIHINIHSLLDKQSTEKYWSKITNIPIEQFNKTTIKQTHLNGKRNNLYIGTCAIRISDKHLFRKIKGWKLGIINNFKV